MPWLPHAYQQKAVKWLLEHPAAGLFLDPGLGKTSITLAALKILRRTDSGRTLLLAPLRVCHSVWPKEVEKWTDFAETTVEVLHGGNKEKRLWESEADILCLNPEGLEWLFGVTKERMRNNKNRVVVDMVRVRRIFKELNITNLVIDESTKFKSGNSQRFKILRQVLQYFRRRWILTGTPAPNGLMDLFSQVFIMDMGHALGEYITHYRAKYFMSTGFGGFTYKPQPGAETQIYAALKKMVLRLDAKDYLDLPEIITNPIRFDLPEKARTLYDELEQEFMAEFDNELITALNAGTATGKLAQVANGGIYNQKDALVSTKRRGKNDWTLVHEVKNEIVKEIVDELNGQPVIIAYEYGHDLARLLDIFGKDTPYIGGGVSAKEGKRIEDQWNRGKIPVLLLQPSSAAHGLNLQGASAEEVGHIIYYAMIWDYENYDQLIKRIARQGSKHKRVMVHLIMARDTVDVAKFYALRAKEKGQGSLLDALRVYVKERRSNVVRNTRGHEQPAKAPRMAKRPARAAGVGVGAGRPARAAPGRPAGRAAPRKP